VPIALVQRANCRQRLEPLRRRFTDADQDSGGEGNLQPSGVFDRPQP